MTNLYHYCSNAAFASIISSREVWASEFSLSNDIMEGRWIREVFIQCCNDKGVLASDQTQLLDHLEGVMTFSGAAGFCMSEEGDLLSQWRGYADNGAGVAIGFNKDYFEMLGDKKKGRGDQFNAYLTKIEYDIAQQKKVVGKPVDQILDSVADGALRKSTILSIMSDDEKREAEQAFRTMLLGFFSFFFHLYELKNPAFAEEREWRLISHLIRKADDINIGQISKMDFRALLDRIVPFTRTALEPLPVASISEIIIGPKNITPDHIIEAFLVKHGWADITVKRSKASYR